MDIKRLVIFGTIIMALASGMFFLAPKGEIAKASFVVKPRVIVSTFSLLESARAVGADEIDVQSIVPLGSDTHMFSPNPKQVAEISNASLFVYNGAGFETWAENLKSTLPKTTHIIDMSGHVALVASDGEGHDEHHDEHAHEAENHDHETEHQHGAYDPHYWLDIDNMIKMTQTFEAEFSKLLPSKAVLFQKNSAAYIAELEKLKIEYEGALKECKNRTLVSNHDAFGYLARSNKLENVSVIGLSSDEQPSAATVARIIDVVKDHGMKTIFFEELINDNVSQTIAKETGAIAVALQPLENISQDELKSQQTYLTIMRENLKKLKTAMECR